MEPEKEGAEAILDADTRTPKEKSPSCDSAGHQRPRSPSPQSPDHLPKKPRTAETMKVVVVGCTHGELDSLYEAVDEVERAQSITVDLILCAGDFQAVRNEYDLRCMNCPDKYKDMRTFWKYYSGEKKARIPTVFVGGNHEASNHLQEMPLGGLVAPNMYYLGNAGVVNFRGLRIAGVSGVYVPHSYDRKRMERPPYHRSDIKTVYHSRREDTDRLLRIKRPVDIFLSHDWPRGITQFGNQSKLLQQKSYLRSDIDRGRLGSPGTEQILQVIQPRFWFAAHMHVKFPALVQHEGTDKETKFLSLDKILPGRDFLQLIDMPLNGDGMGNAEFIECPTGEQSLDLDAEWLSILHTEANEGSHKDGVTDSEMNDTVSLLREKGVRMDIKLESDFVQSAPVYSGRSHTARGVAPVTSDEFCMQQRNMELISTLNLPCYADFQPQQNYDMPRGYSADRNPAVAEEIAKGKVEETGEDGKSGETEKTVEATKTGPTNRPREESEAGNTGGSGISEIVKDSEATKGDAHHAVSSPVDTATDNAD